MGLTLRDILPRTIAISGAFRTVTVSNRLLFYCIVRIALITGMDQQFQSTLDMSANRQARYTHSGAQQNPRDYNGSAQSQPPAGFSYEPYQTPTVPSHPQSMTASPAGTPHARDYSGDGDVAMEDADPYNRMKYPSRPSHSHRSSAQYLANEDSAAARRYSPMKTLSPTSPYTASPQQSNNSAFALHPQSVSARHSPTRSNAYSTPSSQAFYPSPSGLARTHDARVV